MTCYDPTHQAIKAAIREERQDAKEALERIANCARTYGAFVPAIEQEQQRAERRLRGVSE